MTNNRCAKSLKTSKCAKEIEEQENVERYKAIGKWKMTNNRCAKSLKTSKCAKEIEEQEMCKVTKRLENGR
jgi:hypothetical protein